MKLKGLEINTIFKMRRIFKVNNSEIISRNLKYLKGNYNNNLRISKILLKEQKGFCAYSEQFIGFEDATDIEHFTLI